VFHGFLLLQAGATGIEEEEETAEIALKARYGYEH
jgi:hypothetical protein